MEEYTIYVYEFAYDTEKMDIWQIWSMRDNGKSANIQGSVREEGKYQGDYFLKSGILSWKPAVMKKEKTLPRFLYEDRGS